MLLPADDGQEGQGVEGQGSGGQGSERATAAPAAATSHQDSGDAANALEAFLDSAAQPSNRQQQHTPTYSRFGCAALIFPALVFCWHSGHVAVHVSMSNSQPWRHIGSTVVTASKFCLCKCFLHGGKWDLQ